MLRSLLYPLLLAAVLVDISPTVAFHVSSLTGHRWPTTSLSFCMWGDNPKRHPSPDLPFLSRSLPFQLNSRKTRQEKSQLCQFFVVGMFFFFLEYEFQPSIPIWAPSNLKGLPNRITWQGTERNDARMVSTSFRNSPWTIRQI